MGGLGPEIINGSTGKTASGTPSRLCKSSLVKKFMSAASLPTIRTRTGIKMIGAGKKTGGSYSNLKEQATDYQKAKRSMVANLKGSGAGKWMKKPVEQDQFKIWEGPSIPTASILNSLLFNQKMVGVVI